jgi:hypothetical protein
MGTITKIVIVIQYHERLSIGERRENYSSDKNNFL